MLAFRFSSGLGRSFFSSLSRSFLSRGLLGGGSSFGLSLSLGVSLGLGGLQLLSLVLDGRNAGLGIRAGFNGLQGAFSTVKALELLPVTSDVEQLEYGLGRLSADAKPSTERGQT